MVHLRNFGPNDIPALQAAIDADEFHKGDENSWNVNHFQIPGTLVKVIEHAEDKQPIAFVLYTDAEDSLLRISCVWADNKATRRNAFAIIEGIADAVKYVRNNGYRGIIIETSHSNLADFLTKIMKMEKHKDNEYVLWVRG